VWGLTEAPARGWTDGVILAAFAFALVTLVAFVAWERRAPEPMLDMQLFRNPRFSASSASISLAFFALFGAIFFLTQYLQDVRGYSALGAGLRTMPVAAGLVVGGPLAAKLTERLGIKVVVPTGLTMVAAALYLLTLADTTSGYGLIAGSLVLLGLGMASAMAPATDAIMGSLPEAKMSVGSAINDTTRTAGGALGVAVLGSLLASGYRGHMDSAASALPPGAGARTGLARGRPRRGRATRRRPARGRRAGRVRVRHARGGARRGRGRADRRARRGRLPPRREARPRAGGGRGVSFPEPTSSRALAGIGGGRS
jgi:predicted MFS family arabinose efflux permease